MSRREKNKYPYLSKDLNLKKRQDYLDNVYYVNGVKDKKGELVMPPLDEESKEWLNKFNKEFYGASFSSNDEDNLHKQLVSDEEIKEIRQTLSEVRKSQYSTRDREKLAEIYKDIEGLENYLRTVYPQKDCTDANNDRNRCLLNTGKATNTVRLIPWESLNQNTIGGLDLELLYILNSYREDEE